MITNILRLLLSLAFSFSVFGSILQVIISPYLDNSLVISLSSNFQIIPAAMMPANPALPNVTSLEGKKLKRAVKAGYSAVEDDILTN